MARINPEIITVVGGQWGDEGKGKIVDYFAQSADVVIRAKGGDNAGHTIHNPQGKFALHLVPAGIFNPETVNIIGPGVALNLYKLKEEVEELTQRGISLDNLKISSKAHLAFPYHLYLDQAQENRRGAKKIDTTKRGIGPTYMDKAERIGLRAGLLKDPGRLADNLAEVLDLKRELYFGKKKTVPDEFQKEQYIDDIRELCRIFGGLVTDTDQIIQESLSSGHTFVVEGAQGTLLDLDHGTYPNVTSTNTTAAGLLVGAGLPLMNGIRVVGVFKAYQTRVGSGGMPTELLDAQGELIRQKGNEYGTTTGRPRRVGYFDATARRYASQINGFTEIALTRLDTLSGTGDLKICDGYRHPEGYVTGFESDDEALKLYRPFYPKSFEFRGWDEDITGVEKFTDLPQEAFRYAFAAGTSKLKYLGIGPQRDGLLVR